MTNRSLDTSGKGLRVRNFFAIEADTLLRRYKVIETLLPHHKTSGAAHRGEEGRYIEALVRTFLNKHLPASLRAVSGFILCPATKTGVQNVARVTEFPDRHSSQLDIIVYDMDAYPVFERFEEFCIVPPEGVIGVISVKKTLLAQDLADEISALKGAADLCRAAGRRGPFTALLAFAAKEANDAKLNKRIFTAVRAAHTDAAFDPMVNEISVLGRTCVFKTRIDNGGDAGARYIAVDCRTETHIPLQRLLQSLMSVYYDPTRMDEKRRPGFASFRQRTFADASELGHIPHSGM
ncbi:DUF6602 domain-containing protein [Sphingomonas koreensis]|jgi:hypothetical protein|uniref:DUF6602 domain-containing protein n=1 Tax=Sphingomonas koreensis TaxID=93064 RepID=UPI00234E4C9E|nr:DUF6602 domain-containing protein [Sphingomonas koreensis]MDC7812839.1 hypothetical protein [Sphingomonas koreensis]